MAVPSPSVEATSPTLSTATPERLSYEGVVAGTLGALTIALWFFLIDLFQGRPLYTPTVLASALLYGEVNTALESSLALRLTVGFTFVHWLVFTALGGFAAWMLSIAERNANLGFGVLLLFAFMEVGFLATVAVFAQTVFQALAWQMVLIGNLLATAVMGFYFWRRHAHMEMYP
ncbi:hypothetical protein [Candidatus Entotheonella palauensis]|uniref:hypothetical protein n=1 Tax=Candidatus Entotheonella palauensis TaxID=93172 RepID=UPI000B7DADAD|nr:hypothetical protein [Candidatus Entotheonella palauensis]